MKKLTVAVVITAVLSGVMSGCSLFSKTESPMIGIWQSTTQFTSDSDFPTYMELNADGTALCWSMSASWTEDDTASKTQKSKTTKKPVSTGKITISNSMSQSTYNYEISGYDMRLYTSDETRNYTRVTPPETQTTAKEKKPKASRTQATTAEPEIVATTVSDNTETDGNADISETEIPESVEDTSDTSSDTSSEIAVVSEEITEPVIVTTVPESQANSETTPEFDPNDDSLDETIAIMSDTLPSETTLGL